MTENPSNPDKEKQIKGINISMEIESSDKIQIDSSTKRSSSPEFYKNAENYWSTIPATVNGMLGGFGNVTGIDIEGSRKYLNELFKMPGGPEKNYALDCGAGIGRVTKGLLMPIFRKVDMVEQDHKFTVKAKEAYGSDPRLGEIFNIGLHEFDPPKGRYDVVWCQWVLNHLTNPDLIAFFQRIGESLKENGFLVIKENVTSSNAVEMDEVDSSITRPLKDFKKIIKESGFKLVKITKQNNFPKGLYPVYMLSAKKIKEKK